jgi:hypothetical protein
MGHSLHVIDAEHTIPEETGGEFATVHPVRPPVVKSARSLIRERLQDRSRWPACEFLIANEKGPSQPRIPLTACLDSNIAREPAWSSYLTRIGHREYRTPYPGNPRANLSPATGHWGEEMQPIKPNRIPIAPDSASLPERNRSPARAS